MAFEERLRRELHRDAARVEPDVEIHLRAVESRVKRPALPLPLVFASTVIVVLLVIVRGVVPMATGPGGTPAPSGPTAAVAGTYSATLMAADPRVAAHRLTGTWHLQIGADGVATLTPPPGFQAAASSFPGIAISTVGDELRTDALYTDYCSSIGTYRWDRSPDRLRLTIVDDDCALRSVLLTTQPWSREP